MAQRNEGKAETYQITLSSIYSDYERRIELYFTVLLKQRKVSSSNRFSAHFMAMTITKKVYEP